MATVIGCFAEEVARAVALARECHRCTADEDAPVSQFVVDVEAGGRCAHDPLYQIHWMQPRARMIRMQVQQLNMNGWRRRQAKAERTDERRRQMVE